MAVVTRQFERRDTPFPLGRSVHHDSRSRGYAFPEEAGPHKTVLWKHSYPVLNQGNTQSCTGVATAQLINCDLYAPIRKAKGKTWLTMRDALAIYSLGTRLDDFAGEYPPTDEGCDGLSVTKAGVKLGYFSSTYRHCFSFPQVQSAINTGPCLVGITWTNSMFSVDRDGYLRPGLLSAGNIAGGHEILLQGIDYQRGCLTFLNSWGANWGGGPGLTEGQFRLSFGDFRTLLADQGDVVVPHEAGLP